MAQRRMFSMQVAGSDDFLDMPLTSQALYFHLGLYADDDGFVTPMKILRMTGTGKDDLKVLASKGFVIPFKSGVVVVRHWKENNYIQSDRYKPTIYSEEKKMLTCTHNVYNLDTQVRLGRLEREKDNNNTDAGASPSLAKVLKNQPLWRK